jgi:hypothetical protein
MLLQALGYFKEDDPLGALIVLSSAFLLFGLPFVIFIWVALFRFLFKAKGGGSRRGRDSRVD